MPKLHTSLDAIRSFRGIFKRKSGEKSATQELLEACLETAFEDRAEDLRLEEVKWSRRITGSASRC